MASLMSILMIPYQRDSQLARTLASIHMQHEDVELVIVPDERHHEPSTWMNPAPLLNEAFRRATGEICIQQNAECEHMNSVIKAFKDLPRGECWFASAMAFSADGSEDRWYCHPVHRPRADFFCGAIHKADMLEYNEAFTGYGYEDVEMADRLMANGIVFKFLPPEVALVHHQWHPPFTGNSNMRTLYESLR